MPVVSICIPTYNGIRYLGEAIDSALGQGEADIEVVVCDDSSNDGTEELCRGIQDRRFRYLRFRERGGQAANFNRCIDVAQGELLTILHADDRLLPGFARDRLQRLEADGDLGFVFGAVEIIGATGEYLSIDRRWPVGRKFHTRELLETLLLGSAISPPSLMTRRQVALRAGPFRTDLTWGHDWEWAIRLAMVAGAEYDAEPRACYRVHDGSGTAEELNAARNGAQERRILRESLARVSRLDPELKRVRGSAFRALGLRHMYFAEQGLLGGRPAVARHNLGYAVRARWSLLMRPSLWAIWLASVASPSLYSRFLRLAGRT